MEITDGARENEEMKGRGDIGEQTNAPRSAISATSRTGWSLTQEAFDKLLQSLNPDRERAGAKYQELRDNLIRFFRWRGCQFPEDHADETINRVARKMSEGVEVRDMPSYFLGVARLVLLEIQKGRAREIEALGELPRLQSGAGSEQESEARIECLKRCLQSLAPEERETIMQYYQGDKREKIENRKRLAERLGVSLNTLRMRALRLRDRLEACVEECLKNS